MSSKTMRAIDLTGATNLRTLSLVYRRPIIPFSHYPMGLKLPIQGLCLVTTLHLDSNIYSHDAVNAILPCADTLQWLHWTSYVTFDDAQYPLVIGSDLPNLTSLRVDGEVPFVLTSSINAPNPLDWGVCGQFDGDFEWERHLTASRAFPKLQTISTGLDDYELPVGLIHLFPSVQTIISESFGSFIVILNEQGSTSRHLPNLRSVWTSIIPRPT